MTLIICQLMLIFKLNYSFPGELVMTQYGQVKLISCESGQKNILENLCQQ